LKDGQWIERVSLVRLLCSQVERAERAACDPLALLVGLERLERSSLCASAAAVIAA
jgi:hypothetical protein